MGRVEDKPPAPFFYLTMAVRKVYRSDSVPFFNVEINGQRKRIRFTRLTGGDSYYESVDAKEQAALEKHPWYGLKYILWNSTDVGEAEPGATEATPAGEPQGTETGEAEATPAGEPQGTETGEAETNPAGELQGTETGEAEPHRTVKEFSSAAEAKAWLRAELGATAAEVRNTAGIKAFGASKGVNIIIG